MRTVQQLRRALIALATAVGLHFSPSYASGIETGRSVVHVVTADDSGTTRRIVEEIRRRVPIAQVGTEQEKRRLATKPQVYVTIGPAALRAHLASNADGVILSAFSSSQAYREIVSQAASERRIPASTAVYAEPSPVTQLRLISLLYKKPVPTAVILSEKTAYSAPLLQRAATQTGIPLTVESLDTISNLNRVLNRLSDVSAILITPDATVFNSESLRNVLLTTYRNNQAVVGFSTALVKAGVLATTSSEIEDVVAQIAEVIEDYETTGRLPEPQFPKYFSTHVNYDVARSLNLAVDDTVKTFARKPNPVVRQP